MAVLSGIVIFATSSKRKLHTPMRTQGRDRPAVVASGEPTSLAIGAGEPCLAQAVYRAAGGIAAVGKATLFKTVIVATEGTP
jgi:hypothetical protein